jgi:hypothetical protein
MTDTTEAQRELLDARRERAEIDGLIAGLEDQVRAGEAEEAERDLGEKYSLQRLALLRQEAAERRVKEAELAAVEERRNAALAAAGAELESLSPDVLAEACEEALQAIEKVQRLGDTRQAAIARHAQTFLDLGLRDRIRHQDASWVVFEVDGVRFDTRQDALDGRSLLSAIDGERARRAQIPGRLAKGFAPPEPTAHPMARLLAANAAVTVEDGETV